MSSGYGATLIIKGGAEEDINCHLHRTFPFQSFLLNEHRDIGAGIWVLYTDNFYDSVNGKNRLISVSDYSWNISVEGKWNYALSALSISINLGKEISLLLKESVIVMDIEEDICIAHFVDGKCISENFNYFNEHRYFVT